MKITASTQLLSFYGTRGIYGEMSAQQGQAAILLGSPDRLFLNRF